MNFAMNRIGLLAACLVICLTAISLPLKSAAGGDNRRASGDNLGAPGAGEAMSNPDRYAWERFVALNSPANNGSIDTIWETWATDEDTFPCEPDPKATSPCNTPEECAASPSRNPLHSPTWPGSAHRPKHLKEIVKIQVLEQSLNSPDRKEPNGGHSSVEEGIVNRNWAGFDYIVNHDSPLWFVEGQVDSYSRGDVITFPADAVEVKSQWAPILESQKNRYHWMVDEKGRLMGMVAFAFMSKALPNWFWATFEHVDNPGRCNFIGCHDSFGQEPANIAGTYPLSREYPAGRLTNQLLDMFKAAGWSSEWIQQWTYYRLKGTQISYTDSTGRPILLGNSQMEGGFIPTSSCVTCHAKASIAGANMAFPIHNPQRLNIFSTPVDAPPLEGNVGSPDPNWYWDSAGRSKFLQLDFVWAFSNARSIDPKKWHKDCD